MVVLPVPGPPVMMETPLIREFFTAADCCSDNWMPRADPAFFIIASGFAAIGASPHDGSARAASLPATVHSAL